MTIAAGGREHQVGFPLTSEVRNREGGVSQRFRNITNGRLNTIWWTPGTGAHVLWENSGIGEQWKKLGGVNRAGYPTSAEHRSATGVPVQSFRTFNGARTEIYWVSGRAVDLRSTTGIGSMFFRAGGEKVLGHPVGPERRVGAQVVQRFSKGKSIVWSPSAGARIR